MHKVLCELLNTMVKLLHQFYSLKKQVKPNLKQNY